MKWDCKFPQSNLPPSALNKLLIEFPIAAADQHLLLAILSAHKVNVDHNRVAQIVGCTPRACEERIKKLRKLAKECGYELKTPTSLESSKKGKKYSKSGKGKGKFIENEDMILYRKGIVSDDPEVKMEDDMGVKQEIMKGEFGMGDHDEYEYGCGRDMKPFLFDTNPGTRDPNILSLPYAGTAAGLGIPLGVPLEISRELLTSNCRRGTTSDFSSRGAVPLERELSGYQHHYHPAPQIRSPKIERSALSQEPAEFVEISPASKKDPIVIDDDGRGDGYDA